ncbi:MFS transporter [Dehalococcoidia bacterium]|nr:MFS transporter [Dehalococcoidia bacterium]
MAGVQTLARLIEGVLSPLIGPVIDRHGPRLLMVIGGFIVALVFLALTQLNNLWQFYILRGGLLAVGFALAGGLATNTAISNWFIRRRGRALAIAGMGTQLGNFIMAPLLIWVIATHGWRNSWIIFSILSIAMLVIPSALIMRRRPEDIGLHPDGDTPMMNSGAWDADQGSAPSITEPPLSAAEPVWTRRELLKTPSFWLLVSGLSLAGLAFQGINISVAPYVEDLGFGGGVVATALVLRAAVMFSAAPVWGLLSEKADHPVIRSMPYIIQGGSCILFLLAAKTGFLWLAIIVNGLGLAGAHLIQEVLWANYFGRLTLGKVRSTALPIVTGFSAAGPIFMNALFDVTGSYALAFNICIVIFIVSGIVMWIAWPPVAKRYARPEEL